MTFLFHDVHTGVGGIDAWTRAGALMATPHRRIPQCQVPGCSADLSAEPKLYCLRKRICTTHMQAEVLRYPGNQWCRYCFQCAKVEPLCLFDGNKKSCRKALHKRKVRPLLAAAATAAAPASAPMTAAPDASVMPQQLLQLHQQQQAQLMQLQQQEAQLRQQQQQQVLVGDHAFQQQLSAAAHTLQMVRTMADQVAGALAATQAQAAAAAASAMASGASFQSAAALSFSGQQQQLQQLQQLQQGCAVDSTSRTPSPSIDDTFGASSAVMEASAAAAAAAAAAAPAPAANAGAMAGDDAFDNFLETLLACNEPHPPYSTSSTSTAPGDSSTPSRSPRSARGLDLDGPASLAAADFTPFSGQPRMMALPASLAAAAAASNADSLLPAGMSQLPLPSSFAGPSSMMQTMCARVPVPAAVGLLGAGGPSGFVGAQSGVVGLQPQSNTTSVSSDMQRNASEQLQALNAMLQQVQASVLALAQNM